MHCWVDSYCGYENEILAEIKFLFAAEELFNLFNKDENGRFDVV